MKKLLFVLAAAVLLFLIACDEGSFVDPGTMDSIGGGIGIGGGGGGGGGGGSNSTPAIPTGLTASALSSSSIRISWNAVSGASSYNVYRSSSANGTYTWIDEIWTTSYTDTGLNSSTTYYYKITSENYWGESAKSSYVSATTSGSLSGTKWVCNETVSSSGISVSYTITLTFTSSSRVTMETSESMLGITLQVETYNGTYTVSGSKITVNWDAGYSGSSNFTVNGNKLTDTNGHVFTKQ